MKKYLRILTVTLAAAFIFAACDSGGGTYIPPENNPETGEMTEATAQQIFGYTPVRGGVRIDSFKADGADVLKDYLISSNNAPARTVSRAPEAPETTYTLFLNKIAGMFIVDIKDEAFKGATQLVDIGVAVVKLPEKLASIGENSFTDSGITKLQIPAAAKDVIDKKDATLLAKLAENARAVVVEDLLVGVTIRSGALGMPLTFSGIQVYTEDDNNAYAAYTGSDMDVYVKYFGDAAVGEITGGKLTATLGEPEASDLQTLAEYNAAPDAEKENSFDDTFLVMDLEFSNPDVKYFYAKRFYFFGDDEEVWRGVVNKKQITSEAAIGDGTVMVADDGITVRYIYVDNDVVFSGKGEPAVHPELGLTIPTEFSIQLTKGWNAIYELSSGEYTYTGNWDDGPPDNLKYIWSLKSGKPDFKWVLERND